MHPLIQAHWIGMIQKHQRFFVPKVSNHWPPATWRRLDAPSCAVNQSLAEFGSAIFVNAPASPVAFLQLWSICSTWEFSEGINCCCLPSRPEAHRTWPGIPQILAGFWGQLFWITIFLNLYPPTPAAQGGARKGKRFSDTALVANFSILYPPTPAAQWCFLIRGLAAVAAKASAAAGGQGS